MKLVLSLDCELGWGNHSSSISNADKFAETKYLYPLISNIILKNGYKATWAFVGAMIDKDFWDSTKYKEYFCGINIQASDEILRSCYCYTDITESVDFTDAEIAGHSYFHIYSHELDGEDKLFQLDTLKLQHAITKNFGRRAKSYVFPRNQVTDWAVEILSREGFKFIRSERNHFNVGNDFYKRVYRSVDTFINLNKVNTILRRSNDLSEVTRFLRFHVNSDLHRAHLRRIVAEAKYCFEKGLDYHIWFHPHNLAGDSDFKLTRLNDILVQLSEVAGKYNVLKGCMSDG